MNKNYTVMTAVLGIALLAGFCQGAGVKESATTFAKDALQKYVDSGELPGAINVFYKDGVQETCCIGFAATSA